MTQTTITNLDKKLFAELKAEATRENMTVARALALAIRGWVQQRRKSLKSLTSFKPMKLGKGVQRTSEQVDEILYAFTIIS